MEFAEYSLLQQGGRLSVISVNFIEFPADSFDDWKCLIIPFLVNVSNFLPHSSNCGIHITISTVLRATEGSDQLAGFTAPPS